ncbi:MAG: hypothetical protein KC535_01510 [Nanoarchaeota archaeon]|nr:hypothetical protein [Nanoarchaeota archaeon]
MIRSDFTHQEYEPQDFLRLLEHRIRKEIRQYDLLSPKKSYRLEEENSLQSKVLTSFLQRIFQGRLDLLGTELIKTDYLELFLSKQLSVFLEGTAAKTLLETAPAPLRCITEQEMREAARLLELEGTFEPVKQEIIDALAQKYPQTKPSFLKSFVHIQTLKQ